MLAVLKNGLRGLRGKAVLAIGFTGGLRRTEIVGLDCSPNQNEDGTGWIEIFRPSGVAGETAAPNASEASGKGGQLLTIVGKTGWCEVEIGRGARPATSRSPCWRLGCGSSASRMGHCFVASHARMAASGPSGSTSM